MKHFLVVLACALLGVSFGAMLAPLVAVIWMLPLQDAFLYTSIGLTVLLVLFFELT